MIRDLRWNCQESTTYCYNSQKSTGKRKYFTTSLISELQTKSGEFGVETDPTTSRKYIELEKGQCAWIYFDENTTSTNRPATIELEFYDEDNNPTPEVYNVTQKGLLSLGGYTLESYEEYLHTYDSDDKYHLSTSPTDYTQQGLIWGDGRNYSSDIIVVATEALRYLAGENRYDYFHKSDQPQGDTYYSYIDNVKIPTGAGVGTNETGAGTGIDFTNRASAKALTKVIDMGTEPKSAYQYCLSKNKFTVDENGNVSMVINWYLPDVYEMQKILNASDDNADDFRSEALYWSSQPSFSGIYATNIGIANEVTTKARAVSKSTGITDVDRSAKNRIRCLYSSTGISLNAIDMEERVPEGVGGNYEFFMKAYSDPIMSSPAYFNYMLDYATITTGIENTDIPFGNETYEFPTFDNPGTEFGYFNDKKDENGILVEGFEFNPVISTYWTPQKDYGGNATGYYTTLATFDGLSEFTLEGRNGAYRPSTTYREDIQVKSNLNQKTIDHKTLSNTVLNTLDHYKGGNMFDIRFTGNTTYRYTENYGGSTRTTTTNRWKITYPASTFIPFGLAPRTVEIKGSFTRDKDIPRNLILS